MELQRCPLCETGQTATGFCPAGSSFGSRCAFRLVCTRRGVVETLRRQL